MSQEVATGKAFAELIGAQLDEVKAQIAAVEAHAKGTHAQTEINAISAARATSDHIEKRLRELKTITELKTAEKLKSEIESQVAKLKTSLTAVAEKAKGKAAAR